MPVSKSQFRSILRSVSLYLGLVSLFIVGTLSSEDFLTLDNQRDVLWQVSSIGIMAIGMTFVILTAGIDLSVGSILSLCTVVGAMLLMDREWTRASTLAIASFSFCSAGLVGWLTYSCWPGKKGLAIRPWASLFLGLAGAAMSGLWASAQVPHGFGVVGVMLLVPPVGLLVGVLSGLIIAKANLQPFIVTLAAMVSVVGLARYIAGQGGAVHPIYYPFEPGDIGAPAAFETLKQNISVFGVEVVPVPGIFFVCCAIVAWLLLNKLNVGRRIYAIGGNEEAARFSGINTDRVKIFVYAVSGFLSAIAALLYCAQFEQGKADAGDTRELDAIAAVVIGGTSLMGGRGTIGGTIVGVFIFGYLSNILNLNEVSSDFQDMLKGLIIIVAVLLQEGIIARWFTQSYQAIKHMRMKKEGI